MFDTQDYDRPFDSKSWGFYYFRARLIRARAAKPTSLMILRGIQIIRAIAAMMVVIFHIGRLLFFKVGSNVTQFTRIGAAGVDLFFVVSGFIMIYTTYGRTFSSRNFLYHRLVRVAPLYWLITFVVISLSISMPGVSSLHRFSPSNIATSIVFFPSYNLSGQIYPPLIQGWTLVYEMFFYLCLAVASTFMFRARVPVLTLFFSALVIVGLVAPNHSAAFVTYTDPILFEFLMGCLIAELLAGGRLRFGPVTSVMLIVTGGVALAASLASSDPAPLRVIYWGLPSFLIVLGVARGEQFFNFGALRVATAIGDSSYSLYLTHGLVLSAIALLFRVQILQALGGLPFACVLFAACLLAGWLCWRYVERPLTSFLNRQLRGPVSGTR